MYQQSLRQSSVTSYSRGSDLTTSSLMLSKASGWLVDSFGGILYLPAKPAPETESYSGGEDLTTSSLMLSGGPDLTTSSLMLRKASGWLVDSLRRRSRWPMQEL